MPTEKEINEFFKRQAKKEKFSIIIFATVFLMTITISIYGIATSSQRSFLIHTPTYNQIQLHNYINSGIEFAIEEGAIEEEKFRTYLRDDSYLYVTVTNSQLYNGIRPSNAWLSFDLQRSDLTPDGRQIIYLNFREDFTRDIVYHEIIHLALLADGIDLRDHHSIMEQQGWCFDGCN